MVSKMAMRRFEDFVAGLEAQGLSGGTAAGYRRAWKFSMEIKGQYLRMTLRKNI